MVSHTNTKQREHAPKVKIGESRQIVIPKKLYDELRLIPGDYLAVARHGENLVLTPQVFIEKRLAEGLKDIREGRVTGPFDNAQDLIKSLRS